MMQRQKFTPRQRNLVCFFCQEKTLPEYKKSDELKKFLSERGKIVGKSRTGVCAKHQRILTREIKRARHLALLPFASLS